MPPPLLAPSFSQSSLTPDTPFGQGQPGSQELLCSLKCGGPESRSQSPESAPDMLGFLAVSPSDWAAISAPEVRRLISASVTFLGEVRGESPQQARQYAGPLLIESIPVMANLAAKPLDAWLMSLQPPPCRGDITRCVMLEPDWKAPFALHLHGHESGCTMLLDTAPDRARQMLKAARSCLPRQTQLGCTQPHRACVPTCNRRAASRIPARMLTSCLSPDVKRVAET